MTSRGDPPGRVLALGDSITNGGKGRLLGVPGRSWAAWLADALGAPLDNLAADGALTREVLARQLRRARPPYGLGCVYIGVNDVRGTGWDPVAFDRELGAVLARTAALADRLLVVTIPLRLGRPPAGPKVIDANAIVRRAAGVHGAVLVELANLGGWPLVLPDRVHPTPLGQLAIAGLAAAALAADGLACPRRPDELAPIDGSLRARTGLAATWARESARDLLRLLREDPGWTLRTAAGRR